MTQGLLGRLSRAGYLPPPKVVYACPWLIAIDLDFFQECSPNPRENKPLCFIPFLIRGLNFSNSPFSKGIVAFPWPSSAAPSSQLYPSHTMFFHLDNYFLEKIDRIIIHTLNISRLAFAIDSVPSFKQLFEPHYFENIYFHVCSLCTYLTHVFYFYDIKNTRWITWFQNIQLINDRYGVVNIHVNSKILI